MITQDFIENEMISFFNPFAYNGIKYGKSEGGFDVQLLEGEKMKFILFDLQWEDDDKEEIWSEIVDCSGMINQIEIKRKCAKIIEPSILKFCQS